MDIKKLEEYERCLNSVLKNLIEHTRHARNIKKAYSKKDMLQNFFIREIKISRDILSLLIKESYYNAIILTSSLIESIITYKYFTIYPEKLLDYKNFSYIEDLPQYKYAEKLIRCIGANDVLANEIHQKSDKEWNNFPDFIKKYLLKFCKKNYKRFCKKGVIFKCDDDYLNRENYVKYILPRYENMFEDVIKNSSNPTEWIVLKLQYERACKYKHFNSEVISNQFYYKNKEIHFIEHPEDCEWCLNIVKPSIVKALKMSSDMNIISKDLYYITSTSIYWTFFSDVLEFISKY